jgi:hypothetical protein
MNTCKNILTLLAQAPKSQCDPSVLPRLQALADSDEEPKADQLHDILDDCVHASLCSDFMVSSLDLLWGMLLDNEGRTKEQAVWEKHPL